MSMRPSKNPLLMGELEVGFTPFMGELEGASLC